MSAQPSLRRRINIADIAAHKGSVPVVALTAYTAPIARLADNHVDILLVGDSLGMVLYGMASTLPVTLDMMIAHGRAVVNASHHACVIVDMPFGSYQSSPEMAFTNAARILQETGCQGVKLEGGAEMAETIAFLITRGIPVMGHVALMPQHVNTLGGYRFQGRNEAERAKVKRDAHAVSNAGAFAIVLEGTEETLAREITAELHAVTIGIGASVACDGQVLVSDDMLGLTPVQPRFVKTYADLSLTVTQAIEHYAEDVRQRRFPNEAHCYTLAKSEKV